MSGSTSSSSNSRITVVLISSEGERFPVDYKVLAMESEVIKTWYEVDEGDRRCYRDLADVFLRPLPLCDVPSKILVKVIDYCMKHGDKTVSREYLKSYDSKFVKLKPRTLARLIVAASFMSIRSLLDLACVALSDIINDMSPEDICKTLNINIDEFTPQNVDDMYIAFPWEFQENKQRLTPDESANLTNQEKRMMNKEYFLQKVLPALSPAQFAYLTPEEKKEWVLVAVFRRHLNLKLACTTSNYNLYPTHNEKKPADLDQESVQQEKESQTITFDLARLFLKESRNENLGSNNRVFQLFSVCVHFRTDTPGQLYGLIDAKGKGCSEFISLFNRGVSESQPISNNGLVSLTDPSPCGLISATGKIYMRVQLFVRIHDEDDEDDKDDEDLTLSLVELFWDCSRPRFNKNFGCFQNAGIETIDGSVKLYYIVLDHPVEATVDVYLNAHYSFHAFGKIVAYYGDLQSYFRPSDERNDENRGLNFATFKCSTEEAEYCKATLFEASQFDPVLIEGGIVPLTRSRLVVPYGGSLVIEVDLVDTRLRNRNVKGTCEFKSFDCSKHFINGLRCTMGLRVDWKRHEE